MLDGAQSTVKFGIESYCNTKRRSEKHFHCKSAYSLHVMCSHGTALDQWTLRKDDTTQIEMRSVRIFTDGAHE